MAFDLTSENFGRFVTDLKLFAEQGDNDAADRMVNKLRTQFKTLGPAYTKQVLTQAKNYLAAENPTQQLDAINQAGYLLDNPKEFFTAKPTGEGTWSAAGKAFLGGMVPPGAKGPGKQAYEQWKQSQSAHHPLAVGGAGMAGRALPEMALQAGLGGALPAGPLLKGIASGAGAGGLYGAGEGGIQGALQGAVSGGAGAATGGILANRALPAPSRQDVPTQKLIRKQQDEGFWASPGMQTGRKSAEQLDMAIKKQSGTANLMQEHLNRNRAKLNETLAKELGMPEGTSVLDIDTLKMQNDLLNDKLDSFYKGVKPQYSNADNSVFGKVKTGYKNATGLDLPAEYANFEKRLKFLINTPAKVKGKGAIGAIDKSKALRNLTRDLSKRASFHFTDPNGNRELGKVYREMLGTAEAGVTRTVGGKRKAQWDDTRSQQGLLLDLVAKDSGLLQTGKVTPSTLLRVIEKGGTHNLSYINKRRDLWDAARFVKQQENAFENSLATNQRLGHYMKPWKKEGGGFKQIAAEATRGLPVGKGLGINQYLKARHMRNASDDVKHRIAQLVGGTAGEQVPVDLRSLLGEPEPQRTVTRPLEDDERVQLMEQANKLPEWLPREVLPVPEPDPFYRIKGTRRNPWGN